MAARSKARKRAVDVLYEADVRGTEAVSTLAERLAQADPPVPEYAVELVEGVTGRLSDIDQAVELAKSLSTDESPRFVNGVLGRVLREQPAPDRVDPPPG